MKKLKIKICGRDFIVPKLFFPILLFSFLLTFNFQLSTLFAGDYAAELLSLDVGGRACAMGGAQTAVTNDGFSAWWNPAGLLKKQGFSLSAMHSVPFGLFDFNFVELGYAIHDFKLPGYYIIPKLAAAISFASLDIDSIPEFSDIIGSAPIGSFSNQEQVYFLTVAYSYSENIDMGLNVKYIRQVLYDSTGNGVGLDFGTNSQFSIFNSQFLFGAVIKDIGGTKILWNTGEKDERQTNLSLGVAYSFRELLASMDLCYEYEFAYKIGIEYSIRDLLFLRGGINKGVTLGLGAHIPITSYVLGIDYAFSMKDFGNSHHISLFLSSK